ncbi:MAG: hypothetical protein ACKVVP_09125 [Chloroflexota bacterium]
MAAGDSPVEYVVLAHVLLSEVGASFCPDELISPIPYAFRGSIMLMCGLVAGYVSLRFW